MATWTTTLPDTATEGAETHIADHNAIVAAIAEARAAIDAAEATVTALEGLLDGKADGGHKHAAADITSGTLDAARIPTLAVGKISGLQAALDGKADDSDLAAKADASALTALSARVDALEAAAAPEA